MSRLWKSGPGDIVRRCRVCGCRSDGVRFVVMLDAKSGKLYVHNICHPCRVDKNRETRQRRLAKDPGYDSRKAQQWNEANRDRYNTNRRIWYRKKRGNKYRFIFERELELRRNT